MIKNNIEQGTGEWHQLRKGKVTGTVLKDIMGTPKKREDAFYEIIAERLTVGVETDVEYENAMDRGLRLEPDAISAFELEMALKVERTGFAQDDTNPLIANSPDGLIGETEAVEAKCMGGKNHLKMWLTNEIPDEYKWQVVQYFVVNPKLERLYFVAYNPDIPVHPLHIIETTREENAGDIEKAKVAQETFLAEVEEKLKELIKEL
jgi:putative phage-type endonuclease